MSKPILKYFLFIWLAVVFYYAIMIPIRANLSTVKKFTEVKVDSLTNSYTVNKYIPLEIDNSKLSKIKDSADVVILKYQADDILILSKANYEKIVSSK